MPQWDPDVPITFPESAVPESIRRHLRKDAVLLASVNTDAERREDLYFKDFELPPTE